MQKNKESLVHEENGEILFAYKQNKFLTKLKIHGSIKVYSMYKDNTHRRWTDNQHIVQFTFASNDFHHSFNALNTTQALINAYLKKKILPWCNKLTIPCMYNNTAYSFFCMPYNQDKKNKDNNKNYDPYIELGWSSDTISRSQAMNIGQILKFQNALTRAMNWFTPKMNLKYEVIEDKIADDIKAGRFY